MLCKFYQRGICKFGDNCRYSHDGYGQGDRHHAYDATYSDRYNYHPQRSSYSNDQWRPSQNSYHQSDYVEPRGHNRYAPLNETKIDRRVQVLDSEPTLEDYFDILRVDMKDWSDSGMWSLSCYGPAKHSACLTGFEEFSFEEIRIGYIKAGTEGCLNDYFRWLDGLCTTNSNNRNQLSNSHYQQKQHTKSLAGANDGSKQHQENKASRPPPLMSINTAGVPQNSTPQRIAVFGAINQGFGQPQRPLQQPQQAPTGIFQQQQQQPPSGIFQQQPMQNVLQQSNVFQQQKQTPNISTPFFVQPSSSQPFFVQSPQQQNFGATNQPQAFQPMSTPPTVFGHAGNGGNSKFSFASAHAFVGAQQQQHQQQALAKQSMSDDCMYSTMDSLSEEDLREFQSEVFSFIPTVPPPKELV